MVHIPSVLIVAALLLFSSVAAANEVTLHQNPDTRLITWTVKDEGFSIELIQLLPDFVRAIYGKHGFPKEEIERIAGYCVFGTILQNTSDEVMHYRVANWRYIDEEGSHPVKTKTEWLDEWRKAGVTFSWTLLPDKGDFQVGDWQQGFTTINTDREKPFTLVYTWKLDDEEHSGRIENLHCAPAQPPTE